MLLQAKIIISIMGNMFTFLFSVEVHNSPIHLAYTVLVLSCKLQQNFLHCYNTFYSDCWLLNDPGDGMLMVQNAWLVSSQLVVNS